MKTLKEELTNYVSNATDLTPKEVDELMNKLVDVLSFLWKDEPLDGTDTIDITDLLNVYLDEANGND